MSGQLNVMLDDRVVATITNTPNDTNFVAIEGDFANDPDKPVLSSKAGGARTAFDENRRTRGARYGRPHA